MDPNFFIVGGSKCGTTNMSYYLNEHPDVFISKLNEPYYLVIVDNLVKNSGLSGSPWLVLQNDNIKLFTIRIIYNKFLIKY